MIGRVKELLGLAGADAPGADDPQRELRLAAAAILVEAALTDGREDAREFALIRRVLADHFDLADAEAERLVTRATEIAHHSVDWNRFTRVLKQGFEADERLWMLEMLWRVVLADGELHAWEDTLVRQVAALLAIDDRDRAMARQRAQSSLAKVDA
ncbi:MAG: TerB family tellurite resistance protein [Proteobacteria bacterium]|nr:TerB family tellurite resistance protein [Pseudomonadota bacterium]